MIADDPHGWCGRHAVAAALGMLDEADAERYRSHLRECGSCRSRAAALVAEPGDPLADGHIPPAMIARWERARATASGFELTQLESHLARCASCREELAQVARSTPEHPLERPLERPARAAGARLATWWAAAATVVALALAVTTFTAVRPTVVAPPVVPPHSPALLLLVPSPAALGTALRGTTATAIEAHRGPHGELALSFEPPDLPDATPITLELRAPDGTRVAALECVQRDLYPNRSVVVAPGPEMLAAGAYTLEVHARPLTAAPESLTFEFRLGPPATR